MENKKGFIGSLISIIIALALIIGGYFWWQKISVKNTENVIKEASEEAEVEIDSQYTSPQGQVDAIRDMVGKIQDKENAKIENELK